MLNAPASARIDTAIAENDSSVPVIHRTTRSSCDEVTKACRLWLCERYSASGWFSGLALSNAASFWHAASTAAIFG